MRTRIERRTRTVAYSPGPGAPTEQIQQEYDATVPVAPLDMDTVLYRFGVGAVAAIVAGSMAWSTVSIGSLLSTVAPSWVSYIVAGVFDLAWVVCLVFEWLSRRDQQRARLPMYLGWVNLAISMAAITAHGGLLESTGVKWGWAVGAVGAFVSAIAKTLWLVVMHHHKVELSPEQRAWLDQRRAAVQTQLIMASEERSLQQMQDAADATRLALQDSRRDVAVYDVQRVPSQGNASQDAAPVASQPRPVALPAKPRRVAPSQPQPSQPQRNASGASPLASQPATVPAASHDATQVPSQPIAPVSHDGYLTTAEIVALAGVAPTTVRSWANRGRIRVALRDGRESLYDRAEVLAFLQDNGHISR